MNNSHTTINTPWYIRLASTVGRPAVLVGSLAMGAPAEVELAQVAGFQGFTAYLAPAVLSLYAICAATVATSRRKGDRGWLPSILGAGLALLYTMGAQVTAHLLAAGHIASGPWLITAVSAVPALSCVSLLHLAVTPREKTTEDIPETQDDSSAHNLSASDEDGTDETDNAIAAPSVTDKSETRKKGAAPKATLVAIRDAAQNLDATGRKVNAEALADWFGVSTRTGHRYMSQLMAA